MTALSVRTLDWRNRMIASPRFRSWISRMPLLRRVARRDGERVFDLMAGFVHSQVLLACVESGLLRRARVGPLTPAESAAEGIPPERMLALCQAAAALDLLDRRRDGRYALGRLGAAVLAVPGLEAMILHHRLFYRDIAMPLSLLRGETDTELARFWPYVRGGADGPAAEAYSELMAVTQGLVAEETLRAVDLDGVSHLMDVGGGTGAFLKVVADLFPKTRLTLFDLPTVVEAADRALAGSPVEGRITTVGGSFRADPLPSGADAISLIRILFDHEDKTVAALLARVHAALPPDGLLLISEPMSGGASPHRFGDGYFSFYTMAMGTGQVRSPARIAALLTEAGFDRIRTPRMARPFVTQVMTARRQ